MLRQRAPGRAQERPAHHGGVLGRGLDPVADLVDVAVAAGVIEKAGSWFSYGELRLGQGKEKAAEALRERPELLEEIRTKVLERAGEVVLAAGEDEGE